MTGVWRSAGAVLLGLMVGLLLVTACDSAIFRIDPLPGGASLSEPDSVRRAVPFLRPITLRWRVGAWFIAAGAGSWLAGRLSARACFWHGIAAGAGLLLLGTLDLAATAHAPEWFRIGGVSAYLLGALLGAGLSAATSRGRR
jgi:hypothetical protein